MSNVTTTARLLVQPIFPGRDIFRQHTTVSGGSVASYLQVPQIPTGVCLVAPWVFSPNRLFNAGYVHNSIVDHYHEYIRISNENLVNNLLDVNMNGEIADRKRCIMARLRRLGRNWNTETIHEENERYLQYQIEY